MKNYLVGSDVLGSDDLATQPAKVSFLQKPLPQLGGLRVWQIGLAGAGLVSVLAGIITLAVRRK